ncbi:MAG: shikimate kinase [Planctomycetota bacterium]
MSDAPSPIRVALIGLRGTGKSTVGPLLADRLDVAFRDSDAVLAELAGRSADDLLTFEGEPTLREWEARAVADIARSDGVVALGGGAPLLEENRLQLQGWLVVLLDAPDSVLIDRIARDRAEGGPTRPALSEHPLAEELPRLRERRFTLYRSFANVSVSTADRTPSEVVDEILGHLAPSPR